MRGRMIGVYALLSASASQAERVSEPYAKIGYWAITTENHNVCVMKSGYPGKADDDEALIIGYTAQQKTAVLSGTPRMPKVPALTDSLDLELSFLKGRSLNQSWGSQRFQIAKSADTYSFIHLQGLNCQ